LDYETKRNGVAKAMFNVSCRLLFLKHITELRLVRNNYLKYESRKLKDSSSISEYMPILILGKYSL